MPKHHRGAATKQTGVRRPQPKGRQGFAAAGRRCSSSTMLWHRLLVAPCRPTPDPWRTACQDFCHGLLGTLVQVMKPYWKDAEQMLLSAASGKTLWRLEMKTKPNILLLSVDSLRADHLGCYHYPRPTSPYVDTLADQGVVAERLFCPAVPTYPSYTTLYTGQHPLTHGILAHGGEAKLAREAPFLPNILVDSGYTTCGIDNLFRGRIWFGRGYE